MKRKFLPILLLLLPAFILFACKETQEEIVETEEEKQPIVQEEEIPTEPETYAYTEEVVVIQEQPMYYAFPNTSKPVKLIIYNHGQLQRVVTDLNDQYMLKLREYGAFFASKGYAFSASNQHNDNWGQKESLQDIKNSIEWFEQKDMQIEENLYLIGFSMGGLPAINFTLETNYPVASIALLAPTRKQDLDANHVEILKEIPIRIWHGEADVNIPHLSSQIYIENFSKYGKEVQLISIPNAGHYDVEISLLEEILNFFEN